MLVRMVVLKSLGGLIMVAYNAERMGNKIKNNFLYYWPGVTSCHK